MPTMTSRPRRSIRACKQAMVNLFADMGIQPGTLEAGLVVGNPVDGYHKAGLHHHRAE